MLKITDFGLAKLDETEATGVFGTPKYMSPEQSEDSKRVDRRCDIW